MSNDSSLPRIIAIDGPAASGKSVLAERIAAALGYFYFDTGLMYRAVTNEALERGLAIDSEAAVSELAEAIAINVLPPTVADGRQFTVTADGRDVTWHLRRPEVDRSVSAVSAYPRVRDAMTEQQRRIAERGKIVMAGRDIGTVVLPDADCKIFLTASDDARAQRRMTDRLARGQQVTYTEMLNEIRTRDASDSSRAVAPLRAADDAIYLDNSDLSLDETVARVLEIVQGAAHSDENSRQELAAQ